MANLLGCSHIAEAKPCTSPMSTSYQLSTNEGAKCSNPYLYRQVVGSLK